MKTPICDFVNSYANENKLRLHMPGHKGSSYIGVERLDITEIDGADSLYEASGIIAESERCASELFGCETYYSTEGSSQCIRAMIYLVLLYAKARGGSPRILAARNAHKTFHSAVALLDVDVDWISGEETGGYLSCEVTPKYLNAYFESSNYKPTALYITSPDYLGNIADIGAIADICHKHGVLLLVDNAHGAYLRFLDKSMHPMDLGADMCCDSAHKTLPVLTGGAYLHISDAHVLEISDKVKDAMLLFGSTSPSYLILQSLDMANTYLENCRDSLMGFVEDVALLKKRLYDHGYVLYGNEPFKITISTKSYGYLGYELASILHQNGVVCEFADPDFLVMMLSENNKNDIDKILKVLLTVEKKEPICDSFPIFSHPKRALSIREAYLSPYETISVDEACGRVASVSAVGCPPAVPIIMGGEVVDENAITCFKYYGINKIKVVK